MNKFLFFRTSGHGYLQVDLNKYPEVLDKVSEYSYLDPINNLLYAEEDCDYTVCKDLINFTEDQVVPISDNGDICLKSSIRISQLKTLRGGEHI